MAPRYLSTTALAKRIGKEPKELFILLADSGWMQKLNGQWQLTEKGKFEGGVYHTHATYGDYIAWPESVVEHPVLSLLPHAPLTATALSQKWQVSARMVNLLLRDLGWIEAYVHGWRVTALGRACGGEQHEAEQSGIPYVTWPEKIVESVAVAKKLEALKAQAQVQFALDGHPVNSTLHARVDNWLFLNRVLHAVNFCIDLGEQAVVIDFWLPDVNLALIIWPKHEAQPSQSGGSPAAKLHEKLALKEALQEQLVDVLEIQDVTLEQLDELLSRELLRRGRAVY